MCGPYQKQNTYNHSDKKLPGIFFIVMIFVIIITIIIIIIFMVFIIVIISLLLFLPLSFLFLLLLLLSLVSGYQLILLALFLKLRRERNRQTTSIQTNRQIDRNWGIDREEKKRLLHLPNLICNLRTFHVAKLRMKLVLFATGVDVCVAK